MAGRSRVSSRSSRGEGCRLRGIGQTPFESGKLRQRCPLCRTAGPPLSSTRTPRCAGPAHAACRFAHSRCGRRDFSREIAHFPVFAQWRPISSLIRALQTTTRISGPHGFRLTSPMAKEITMSRARRLLSQRPAVLRLEDRTVPSTLVYVNDNWYLPPGNDLDHSGTPSAGEYVDNRLDTGGTPSITGRFGVKLFATVQSAVDAVDAGGKVRVLTGTYAERVVIARPL